MSKITWKRARLPGPISRGSPRLAGPTPVRPATTERAQHLSQMSTLCAVCQLGPERRMLVAIHGGQDVLERLPDSSA